MPGKCLLRRLHSPWLQKAVSDLGTGGFDWMPGIRRDLWLNPLCTADMWRAWEGNKANSKSPSPKHPWHVAMSHCWLSPGAARPLVHVPSICTMCLLNGKAVGWERAHVPVYAIDINISMHTGQHIHTNIHAAVEKERGRMVW